MNSISYDEFMKQTGGTGDHIRLCMRKTECEDYTTDKRSITKQCAMCTEDVWYDPKASILPEKERIVCMTCFSPIAMRLLKKSSIQDNTIPGEG